MWSIFFITYFSKGGGIHPKSTNIFLEKNLKYRGAGGYHLHGWKPQKVIESLPQLYLEMLLGCQFESSKHFTSKGVWVTKNTLLFEDPLSVSFEGPLASWMSVLRVPSLAGCQFWGSPHLLDVSFEGPLNCWMSVLRVPSLAGCQFLEGPLTCLDVMWSLFWSKLDLKMKIWPTSGRFGENCLLKLVLVCPILTQWWNKKNWVYFPFKKVYFLS